MSLNLEKPLDESFFYHFICHTCKSKSCEVKLCSGCRMVSYCSSSHQKMDWINHKGICKCVQTLMKEWRVSSIFGIEAKTPNEWISLRLSLISLIENKLNRLLFIEEQQMLFFPNVCNACFSASICNKYKCAKCGVMNYCSEEHKNRDAAKHNSSCQELMNCYIVDNMLFTKRAPMFILPDELFIVSSSNMKNKYPENMMCFLSHFYNKSDIAHLLFSELWSGTLSIAYAIANCVKLKYDSKDLVVHIVGASNYEKSFVQSIDWLFHCLPSLNNLNISLIGPEAEECGDLKLCIACEKDKSVSLNVYKCLYQEFEILEAFEKPDIVVAFNCGFCEFSHKTDNSWKEAITSILNLKYTLFLFTSYTQNEAKEDYNFVKTSGDYRSNIYFTKFCYDNPFKSLRPRRNWENCNKEIFYLNNYLTMVELSGI